MRNLFKKFSFSIMDTPVNTSMEHVVEVFERRQKFGYLLLKIDSVVMGHPYNDPIESALFEDS